MDLLGVFGRVTIASESLSETPHIHSLGFIVNECPVRNLLDFEQNHDLNELLKIDEAKEAGAAIDSEAKLGLALIIGIISLWVIIGVYIALKNRGKLCKKGTKNGEAVFDDENSTQMST